MAAEAATGAEQPSASLRAQPARLGQCRRQRTPVAGRFLCRRLGPVPAAPLPCWSVPLARTALAPSAVLLLLGGRAMPLTPPHPPAPLPRTVLTGFVLLTILLPAGWRQHRASSSPVTAGEAAGSIPPFGRGVGGGGRFPPAAAGAPGTLGAREGQVVVVVVVLQDGDRWPAAAPVPGSAVLRRAAAPFAIPGGVSPVPGLLHTGGPAGPRRA